MRARAKYAVIYRHREKYSVLVMCRFFSVSTSGYYSFVKNLNRPEKDAALAEKIRNQQDKCFHTYGYRRMWQWLKNSEGICHNPKTILRVMKKYGLLSEIRRRRRWQQMGQQLLEKWIPIQSSKHKWSPKTYTQTTAMVQNLIAPYIGQRKIQDLRTFDIEQFYATLSQTPCGQYIHGEKQKLTPAQQKRLLSSTSIREVHTLLKTAFSYAVEWDLIRKSPLPREAPKINTEERTIWDEHTIKGRTSGLAQEAEAGRAIRPRKVQ